MRSRTRLAHCGSCLAGLATGLLVLAAPAAGGSAQLIYGTLPFDDEGLMEFRAAPGERNAVTQYANGFRDAAHPVSAGAGCVVSADDPHRVFCGSHERTALDLGDGDDGFRVARGTPPIPTSTYAGTGDDVVVGGPGPDEVSGASGGDKIYGGAGDDSLGDGLDVEIIDGERRIVPADDIVYGGPGDDSVSGRYGHDRLSGGPGNDGLGALDGRAANASPIVPLAQDEEIDCGRGVDWLAADFADGFARDCELPVVRAPRWRTIRVGGRRAIEFKARCAWLSRRRCRGRAIVQRAWSFKPVSRETQGLQPPRACLARRGPSRLATARFDIRAGRVGRVSVPVPRQMRSALRRRACVAATIHFSFRGRDRWFESTRSLVLRRARDR